MILSSFGFGRSRSLVPDVLLRIIGPIRELSSRKSSVIQVITILTLVSMSHGVASRRQRERHFYSQEGRPVSFQCMIIDVYLIDA